MAKYKLKLNLSDGTTVTTDNTIDIPTQKYRHNLQISYSNTHYATFSIITSQSTPYASLDELVHALIDNGFNATTALCPAQGQFTTSAATNLVTGLYARNDPVNYGICFYGIQLASTTSNVMTINQNIVTASSWMNNSSLIVYDVIEGF